MPYKDDKSPEAIKSRNECARRYYEKNKEKSAEYFKTDKGKKVSKISNWKRMGIINDNWDTLYDKYINAECCEKCNVKFDNEINNNKKCIDHNHETGQFRNILCMKCNKQLYHIEYKDKIDKQKLETIEREKQRKKDNYAKCDKVEKKKIDAEYYEANKERIKERARLYRLKKRENNI